VRSSLVAVLACAMLSAVIVSWSPSCAVALDDSSKDTDAPVAQPLVKAKPSQAPGSKVIVDIPPTFEAAERFVGFWDDSRRVSIVIADMPVVAYDDIAKGFTPDKLAARGFKDYREGKLDRSDTYMYRRAVQDSAEGPHEKFILVFKSADATSILTINVPKPILDKGEVKAEEFEAILQSARPANATVPMRQVASISDPAPLKLAMSFGQTQIWTIDGKSGEPGSISPAIMLSASVNFDEVDKPVEMAANALRTLAGHSNIQLGKPKTFEVPGNIGVEFTATATDAKTNEPRSLYQLFVAPKDGGFVRLIGIAPRAQQDEWFVIFRRTAKTLKLAK
jgi:hypothetical protein